MWKKRDVQIGFLLVKPKENRPLERPKCRWENNIKIDLQEVGWGHGPDWSGSEQGQVVGPCESGDKPSGSIKC
jgi:hypothetical protein